MGYIGNRLRFFRTQKKMTQDDLARAIGTTKQTIYKYEVGIITNIPVERVEQIAVALGVTPADLMGWKSNYEQSMPNVTAREAFRINLLQLMAEHDISQSAISKDLNVTSSTVSDWCSGKKYPRINRIEQLASMFHIPITRLTGEVSPSQDQLVLCCSKDADNKPFPEILRSARKRAGFTQQEISDQLCITKSTYSNYESGRREPDIEKIRKLAHLLGITTDVLLGADYSTPVNADEGKMLTAYRGATEAAREIAFEVLINHQTVR